MRTIYFFLVILFLIGCGEENEKLHSSVHITKPKSNKVEDSKWIVLKEYYDDVSENYPFLIRWSKGEDSILEYRVESSRKDTCLPITYSSLMVKSNSLEIYFRFWEYNQNLPDFDSSFSSFNVLKCTSITINNLNKNSTFSYDTRLSIDSFCSYFLSKQPNVKKE